MSGLGNGKIVRVRKLLKSLGRAHREIAALYLFGSQAEGKAGPISDVDVAVLLDDARLTSRKQFDFHLNLIAEAMRACRRPDVDVVLLNKATPLLAYEVVRSGKLLFERDHERRVEYEVRAMQHYLDSKPLFATADRYLKRRLREGTYGG